MKHVFDANGISYQCYDKSFTDINDVAKTQELADRFDPTKFCRLDAFLQDSITLFSTLSKKIRAGPLLVHGPVLVRNRHHV